MRITTKAVWGCKMKACTMKNILSKMLSITSTVCCLLCALPAIAQFLPQGTSSYPSSFNASTSFGGCQKKDCSNSTCQLTLGNNGQLPEKCPSGTRYDVDPNCVMNKNAQSGSCMDTMPVSSINRVAETNCYRANGAGGNPNPRNHLGTDYAAVAGTYVTAAADGKIVFKGNMGGAGRTIVIQHEKKCQCSAGNANNGCDDTYTTIYMHLLAFAEVGGSVKKGDIIGKVGGSNYIGGKLCDYPKKAEYKGDCYGYGPHLHFEIHSGSYTEKGYAKNLGAGSIKDSIINPLCDDIQSFCGGCSYNVQDECTGKTNTNQWTTLNDEAKQNKTVANPPENFTTSTPNSDPSGTPQSDPATCHYEQFMPQNDTCYFCPLFKTIFNTASSMSASAYKALASSIANLVLIGFALWISVFVLKHVSALEVKKPSKMIQELLVQAFRVLIVVLILKMSYHQVLGLTLAPVFNTGMNYAQSISDVRPCPSDAAYMQNINGYTDSPSTTGALPASMGQNIVCSIKSMQDNVYRLIAFGSQCRCLGWKVFPWIEKLLPNFAYIITGWVLKLGGLILLLAFPWCLIDCLLNMAVAAALMPAAIGAWAFKITSQYLKKIWDMFLNAMFQFVFLSIVLYIIMIVVSQFVSTLESYSTEYKEIIHPIRGLAFWGVNAAKLVMTCLLGWVFLDQGKELAKKFASAPDMNIGRATGGFFAQAADRIALGSKDKDGKRQGGILGITKGAASLGGMAVNHYIGMPIRQRINQNKINNLKTGGTQIKDAAGNTIGYEKSKRNLLGQKVTTRVNIEPGGVENISKEKVSVKTQIQNWARDKKNENRLDTIEKQDKEAFDMLSGPTPEGLKLSVQKDENGQILSRSLLDESGKLVVQERFLENGQVEITSKHGTSVYKKGANGKNVLVTSSRKHKNLLGEDVILTANAISQGYQLDKAKESTRMRILRNITPEGSKLNDIAKTYATKSKTSLNAAQDSQSITKDHLLSVRTIKDAQGNIIQKDYAWKNKVVDMYAVQQDGALNQKQITDIFRGSNMNLTEVSEGIALTVMKSRDATLSNKFQSRKTVLNNGVLTIEQKDRDGSTSTFEAKFASVLNVGGQRIEANIEFNRQGEMLSNIKIDGQDRNVKIEQNGQVVLLDENGKAKENVGSMLSQLQMVSTLTTIDSKGNKTIVTDNGVQSRVITQEAGKNAFADYKFNSNYYQKYKYTKFMDGNGRLAETINENEAMLGLNEYDRQLHAAQVRNGQAQRFDLDNLKTSKQENSQDETRSAPNNQNKIDPELQKKYDQERKEGSQNRKADDKRKKDKKEAERQQQLADAIMQNNQNLQRRENALRSLNKAKQDYENYLAQMGPAAAYQDSKLFDLKAKLDSAQMAYNQALSEHQASLNKLNELRK